MMTILDRSDRKVTGANVATAKNELQLARRATTDEVGEMRRRGRRGKRRKEEPDTMCFLPPSDLRSSMISDQDSCRVRTRFLREGADRSRDIENVQVDRIGKRMTIEMDSRLSFDVQVISRTIVRQYRTLYS